MDGVAIGLVKIMDAFQFLSETSVLAMDKGNEDQTRKKCG